MKWLFIIVLVAFSLQVFNDQLTPNQITASLGDDGFEDFERDVFPAWTATGLWHIEDNTTSRWPTYDLPSNSHFAWYGDNRTNDYNTSDRNSGTFTSDSINLTLFDGNIELRFWSWAHTEDVEGVDEKKVYISPNGGASWDHLGNITDSSTWQAWVFDITDYREFDNVKIRFFFNTVDEAYNNYPGWKIDNISIGRPVERFNLRIEQDYYAGVHDVRVMEFYADSYFDHGMDVSISIDIETPSGTVENLFYKEGTWIDAFGSWVYDIEYEFTEVGHYNVYFRLVDDAGTGWIADCWWEIEGDFFGVWIFQDNYAKLYEVGWMEFNAESYFDYGMYVSIGLDIETPSGAVENLYFEESLWLEAYESWFQSIDYEFTEVGHYNVYFRIANETGGYWTADCWWEITEKPQDTYMLEVYQENQAGITDIRPIDFALESFFDYPTEVIIHITITSPSGVRETLFYEEWVWIDAYGRWDLYQDYEFREAGGYVVVFAVIDEPGNEWFVDCQWSIEEDFIGLWIEQDNYAGITDRRWMNFQAKNYFNGDIQAIIEIDIETPSGAIIDVLYEEWTNIGMYETWKYDYEYEFNEVGEYFVYFKLTSPAGEVWDVECWWNIEENFFGLWIEQDTFAHVNERRWMYFDIKNYFDYSREIDITISLDTPSGTEDVYDEMDVIIDAYGTWHLDLEYEFSEIGFYKVYFIVIDESGAEWYTDCEWKVKENEYFTLKIDQDTRAEVGDERRMNFYAESQFGHAMDVNISINIETPSGDQELLYSEDFVYIEEYGAWGLSLNYEFTEAGEYTVYFVLIDDIGAKWVEECPWKIEESGTETKTSGEQEETTGEQQSETPSITPGFESLVIILAIAAVVSFSKKR